MKTNKRIIAILLITMMLFTSLAPAFAADDTGGLPVVGDGTTGSTVSGDTVITSGDTVTTTGDTVVTEPNESPVITTDLSDKTVEEATFSFTASANDQEDGKLTCKVTLNDVEVTGTDGSYEVELVEGNNTISIVATDSNSARVEETYTVRYEVKSQEPSGEAYEIQTEHIYQGEEVVIQFDISQIDADLSKAEFIKYSTNLPLASGNEIKTSKEDAQNGILKFTVPTAAKVTEYRLNNGGAYHKTTPYPQWPDYLVDEKLVDLPEISIQVEQNGEDTEAPVITLKGEESVNVALGQAFTDPGYIAEDNDDPELVVNVTYTKGEESIEAIDTTVAGTYTVHYNTKDKAENIATEVIRTVIVAVVESEAPVIQLVGAQSITIAKDSVYTDLGVNITDDMDKSLQAVVTYSKDGISVETIDTSIAGEYVIHYNAADFSGNDAVEVTRNMTVVSVTGADFTASLTGNIEAGSKVDFNGLYPGEVTSWEWDFDNDGDIDSREQNPQHSFFKSGTYDVKLVVNGTEEKVKAGFITIDAYVPSETAIGWLNFQNGIHNNGVTADKAPISKTPKTEWTANTGWMESTALVVGDDLLVMSSSGKLSSYDRKTGEKNWGPVASAGGFVLGNPAYGNGKVFVPGGNGHIYAVDIETGEKLWDVNPFKGQTNSPVIFKDGLVYTGTWDNEGSYVCVTEDGKLVWKYDDSFYFAGATIIGDKLIVGDEGGNLLALDRFTGEEIQKINVGAGSVRCTVVYIEDNNKIYFGTKNNQLVSYEVDSEGTIDAGTKRTLDCGAQVTATPLVFNGRVYVGTGGMTGNAGVKVIDEAKFEIIYTIPTEAGVQGSPVLTTAYATEANKNTVFVYFTQNYGEGKLTCVKDFEGNTEPQITLEYLPPNKQYCMSTPSIFDGYLYFGNDSGNVFAIKDEFEVDLSKPQITTDLSDTTVGVETFSFNASATDDKDANPIFKVRMNDVEVSGTAGEYNVNLLEGTNTIKLTATDSDNNVTEKVFTVTKGTFKASLSVENRVLGKGDLVVATEFEFNPGDTVEDLLRTVLDAESIDYELENYGDETVILQIDGDEYNDDYDWFYEVDGVYKAYEISNHAIKAGDIIRVRYLAYEFLDEDAENWSGMVSDILISKIAEAKKISEETYTADSFKILSDAIASAEAIANDPQYESTEEIKVVRVKAEIAKLKAAIEGLVEKGNESPVTDSVTITADDLNQNAYDKYYYLDGVNYLVDGKAVTFKDENNIEYDGNTVNLRNKKISYIIQGGDDSVVEAGETVTITFDSLDTPIGLVGGKWNSTYAGETKIAYNTDIVGLSEIKSENLTAISFNIPSDATGEYHLTGGSIFEKANEWSPGIDGIGTEGYFGKLPDITIVIGKNTLPAGNKVTLSVEKRLIGKGDVVSPEEFEFSEGETTWDLIKKVLDERNIEIDYRYNETYKSVYIAGVDGDAEFDYGQASGWMYTVDGVFPEVGVSKHQLKAGEVVRLIYSPKGFTQDWTSPIVNNLKEEIAKAKAMKAEKYTAQSYKVLTDAIASAEIVANDSQYESFDIEKELAVSSEIGKILTAIEGLVEDGAYVPVASEIPDDFENDCWLNKYFHKMKNGSTYEIKARRVPEMITDAINNDVSHPEYIYEIVNGDSVELSGSTLRAVKEGVSIVKVTYNEKTYKGVYFGACSAINAAYMIVDVTKEDPKEATITTSITERPAFDTIYYSEGDTTPYEFTVDATEGSDVKVTCNGQALTGNDGNYTANLENRSNVIVISATKDGETENLGYVIDARKIEVTIKNLTSPNKPIAAKEKVAISFKGVVMPVYKLATIYNPVWTSASWGQNSSAVVYQIDGVGEVRGACKQWDLATNNTIEVVFPAEGTYELKDGKVYGEWWGSKLGAHMEAAGPGEPNLNADVLKDFFSRMPDISIEVAEEKAAEGVQLDKTEATIELDEELQLTATVLPEDATVKTVKWSSSDSEAVSVTENGLVKALKPNASATITATADANEMTATCEVSVLALKAEEIIQAINLIPVEAEMNYSTIKVIEDARRLYDFLAEDEKAKVSNFTDLVNAEDKIDSLKALLPYEYKSLDGKTLSIVNTGRKNGYGHPIYNVMIPTGTTEVNVVRHKNLRIQNTNWGDIIPEGITEAKISTEATVIMNYDTFTYHQMEFVEYTEMTSEEYAAKKAELNELITQAKAKKESDYTSSVWSEFQEKVNSAEKIYADETVLDFDLIKAIENFDKVIKGLVKYGFKVSSETIVPGDTVTITLTGLVNPNETKDVHTMKTIYSTNMPGLANVESAEAKDDANLLSTISFVVPEEVADGEYKLTAGHVYKEWGGQFYGAMGWYGKNKVEFFKGALPDITINVGKAVVKDEIDTIIDEAVQYQLNVVREPEVGTIGGEWTVFSVARSGCEVPEEYYSEYYSKVVDEVKAQAIKDKKRWDDKVTDVERVVIALNSIGKNPTDIDGINLLDYIWNKKGNFPGIKPNAELGGRQGANELIFALIALDSKDYPKSEGATITRDQIIDKILSEYQVPTGGFGLAKNNSSMGIDITGMAIQSLAKYYDEKPEVKNAVDRAISELSVAQDEKGGFTTNFAGVEERSSEAICQTIVALTAMGIDPNTDARFVKDDNSLITALLEYYDGNGGFKHMLDGETNGMATDQALYALVAYDRFRNNKSKLYDMNPEKPIISEKPVIITDLTDRTTEKEIITFTASANDKEDGKVDCVVSRNDEKVTGTEGSYSVKLSEGENTIKITATDSDSNAVEKTFTVICNEKAPIAVKVTGVRIDNKEIKIEVDEPTNLNAIVFPENADDKSVVWSSSDEKTAKVDEHGLVTPVAEGKAIITVTTNDGEFTDSCEVTINKVEKINIDKNQPGQVKVTDTEVEISVSPVTKPNYEFKINAGNKNDKEIKVKINQLNKAKVVIDLEETKENLPRIEATKGKVAITIPKSTKVEQGSVEKLELMTEVNKEDAAIKDKVIAIVEEGKELKEIKEAFSMGGDQPIIFSDYVKIVSKGNAGKDAAYIQNGILSKIEKFTSDTEGKAKNLEQYSYDEGSDLVIKTNHFTDFVVYLATAKGTSGGGGGGSLHQDKITLSIDLLTIDGGYILEPTEVKLESGDTAWTLLKRELEERNIEYSAKYYEKYESIYIQSITGEGEFDHGSGSGWMYCVNGKYPPVGATNRSLKDGDVMKWRYTTNLGDDLGAGMPKDDGTSSEDAEISSEKNPEIKIGTDKTKEYLVDFSKINSASDQVKIDIPKEDVKVVMDLTSFKSKLPNIIAKRENIVLDIPKDTAIVKGNAKIEVLNETDAKADVFKKGIEGKLLAEEKLASVDYAVEIGNEKPVIFDKALKLTLKGLKGKKAAYSQGGEFGLIKLYEDKNEGKKENEGKDKYEYSYYEGNDLVVITNHFTMYLAYTLEGAEGLPVVEVEDYKDQAQISAWATDAVMEAKNLGIAKGFADGTFQPQKEITRAEFTAIIGRIMKLDENTSIVINFKDVSSSDWYYNSVNAAYKADIIKGYGEKFKPNAPISREEMAAILARVLKLEEGSINYEIRDMSNVSDWAKKVVSAIYDNKVIVGYDNFFKPQDNATREMAAAVCLRVYKSLNGLDK